MFGWPQAIAGNVALMQAHQFRFHHFDKARATLLRYFVRGTPPDEGGRDFLVHATAHDFGNGFSHQLAMPQAKYVRLSSDCRTA